MFSGILLHGTGYDRPEPMLRKGVSWTRRTLGEQNGQYLGSGSNEAVTEVRTYIGYFHSQRP